MAKSGPANVKPVWLGSAIILLALGMMMPLAGNPAQVRQGSVTPRSTQTGLLYDAVYLKHLAGNTGHPERPERLTAIWNGLEKAGLLQSLSRIAPRRVTQQELRLVHTAAYLDFDDPLAKYDCHWSPVSARRYKVDQALLWELLALEDEFSNPTIDLIK